MRATLLLLLTFLVSLTASRLAAQIRALRHPDYRKVEVSGPIWGRRVRTNADRTLAACLEKCESTGRIRNFEIAAGRAQGKFTGYFFNDSDVYKVLEGAAYILGRKKNPELEARIDAVIDKIAAAQCEDGYLDTYFELTPSEKRWTNTRVRHELYCAGHLIEAGIAYHEATGKRKLLDVAIRLADCIDKTFGPGRKTAPPGHQEIELALFRLADHTGEQRYAKLGQFFLETRGRDHDGGSYGQYAQDHAPIRAQKSAVGHAVRAMYMYCAMADLAARTDDQSLVDVLDVLWRDVTTSKMYVTGAIGAEASHEGFAKPFELPNDDAYCESCASVGLAMWADRMLSIHRDARYADVMERVLYNGLLSGISLTGDRFLYVNPLASRGKHHRQAWYACACCPTNFVRFLPKVPERIYAYDNTSIYVDLYAQSRTTIPVAGTNVTIEQQTRYPWDGTVKIKVTPETPTRFSLRLRRPGWCKGRIAMSLSGLPFDAPEAERGFMVIERKWEKGDTLQMDLPMPVRRVYSDKRVKADVGRVAIARGPLVYCVEAADNAGYARNLALPAKSKFRTVTDDSLLPGAVFVEADALRRNAAGQITETTLRAIPYQLWGYREPGEMVVWIPEDAQLCERPGEGQRFEYNGMVLTASHCYRGDTVQALVDGKLPNSSGDHSLPRMTWWPEKGGKDSRQWVGVEFASARKVTKTSVYWFDDRDRSGGCRVPADWKLLYLDGKSWRPVTLLAGQKFSVARDELNEVTFEPVQARAFRLVAKLRPGYSGGVLEWTVE